jgi:hypothetical protein
MSLIVKDIYRRNRPIRELGGFKKNSYNTQVPGKYRRDTLNEPLAHYRQTI